GALARDLPHGRVRAGDARHRDRVHRRRPVLDRPAGHVGIRGRDPHVHGRVALGVPLVARAGGGRDVFDRRLCPARGQADLLGPALAALPPPRGRARPGVGGARHPRRRARRLRLRPRPRARAGRHGHRAAALADPRAVTTAPYVLELGVGALMLVVFAVGVLGRRPVGAIATAGVLLLAAAALALKPSGPALNGMFVQDGLAIFAKRVFLAATFIGFLSGLGSPDRALVRRSTEYHLLLLGLGLIAALAGFAFKIAAFPFHMWVPDAYEAGPTSFVAWLSVAPKAAGFIALFRVYFEGVGDRAAVWAPAAAALATVTMLAGNLMALPQTNTKRMLAYSGIAQIGYMLVGLAAASASGTAMILFYLVAYVFANMGAFLVVEAVARAEGSEATSAFRGLAQRSPLLALAMLLFLLSLGGIPF